MTETERSDVIVALSARMIALEVAVCALAGRRDRRATVAFDRFAEEAIDRYVALPVDETFLMLLRQSLADIRALIDSPNVCYG